MKNFKFGFTLAEVLITLAIIGVVAALTMPTLLSNYHKKEVETKLQRFYATMQQAIKMSTVDNGPTTEWDIFGHSGTETTVAGSVMLDWFNKYLAPYINFSSVELDDTDSLNVIFLDGSRVRMKHSFINDWFYTTRNCGENCKVGVDTFIFRFSPVGPGGVTSELQIHAINPSLEPYAAAWKGTIEDAKYADYYDYGCYENGRYFCTKLIQLNGWKIPNDYPYKF